MAKENLLSGYKDIVEPRRFKNDSFYFMMRYWSPQPAHRIPKTITPSEIKQLTLESEQLNKKLDDLSVILNKDRNELQKEVIEILEEIGLDRKMTVVKWVGAFTASALCAMCNSVFVNERNIFSLKSTMGSNPVVFVPSHRSYSDFIIMTYICYCYDIELPAVAAGINFRPMLGVGKIMRDLSAFYIRRSFDSDKVYTATFKQYVKTLVTKYHAPLHFFIEGTRSRSGKSMTPKYGFISMVMEPLFDGEVTDITFVPVSVSYDRFMDGSSFAYELLGVPKIKETTLELIKSSSIVKENFGNVYVNIGKPFSAVEYFGSSFKKGVSTNTPEELKNISNNNNELIQNISSEIVNRQQSGMIITTFQLVSVGIMVSLHDEKAMDVEEIEEYVIWLSSLLKVFGGLAFDYNTQNFKKEFETLLKIHKSTIAIDKNSKVLLISTKPYSMTNEMKKTLKGHCLSDKTMSSVIPAIMTQLSVNSLLHCIISGIIICQIIAKSPLSREILLKEYRQMRLLLKFEFPIIEETISNEFDASLENLIILDALKLKGDIVILGNNLKIHKLFEILFWPFLSCLKQLGVIILSNKKTYFDEKTMLRLVQEDFERSLLNEHDIHPYCLSLEFIQNCIQGYNDLNFLIKQRENNAIVYKVNMSQISNMVDWFSTFPRNFSKFYLSNPVMTQKRGLLSRL